MSFPWSALNRIAVILALCLALRPSLQGLFDRADLVEGPEGWAVWYSRDGSVVGVLAENWDSAYERGQSLIERGAPLTEAMDSSQGGE